MINLIEKSKNDKKMCDKLEQYLPDEFAAEGCSYHIQQAIEKQLKAYILFNGYYFEKTHDISKLLKIIRDNDIDFETELSYKIEDMADTLTLWEASSRYDPFVSFSERKYSKAKEIYDSLSSVLKTCLSQSVADERGQYCNKDDVDDDIILNSQTDSRK